jgi:hypothetical protein
MHTPPAQSCLPEPQLIALFESALATVKVLPSFTVPEHERRATGMALEGGLREVRCALLPPRGRTSPLGHWYLRCSAASHRLLLCTGGTDCSDLAWLRAGRTWTCPQLRRSQRQRQRQQQLPPASSGSLTQDVGSGARLGRWRVIGGHPAWEDPLTGFRVAEVCAQADSTPTLLSWSDDWHRLPRSLPARVLCMPPWLRTHPSALRCDMHNE